MLTRQPLYPTNMTPEEIIGPGNMSIFEDYYKITSSPTNAGEFPIKRLNKEIGADTVKQIAFVLKELREYGFYPDGWTKDLRIRWSTIVKSDSHILRDKGLRELEGKSIKELSAIARQGFRKLSMDMPSLKSGDIDRERVAERPF